MNTFTPDELRAWSDERLRAAAELLNFQLFPIWQHEGPEDEEMRVARDDIYAEMQRRHRASQTPE